MLDVRMGKTDGLSKRLDWKVEVEKDNKNQKLIIEEQIHSLTEVVIEGPEVDILEEIAREKNERVVIVVEEIKKAEVKVLRGDEQQIEGKLVLKKGKVYVPKDKELRVEIIWLHYDVPAAEHEGK